MHQRFAKVKGLAWVLVLLFALLGPQVVLAKEYPGKPVSLIVPSGAGSATDLIMRAAVSVAADYLGQPIVVRLKPGGGGAIGSDFAAKAKPDGYTLLAGVSTWSTGLPAVENRSKGPDDFSAVCRINYSPTIIVARKGAPFKTFKEMMAWARANPGQIKVGTPGPWSPPDVVWKFLMKEEGIKAKVIPFQGGGKMTAALLGGHIDVGHSIPSMAMRFKGTGKMTFMLILDGQRLPELPDVPTSVEGGLDPRINNLGSAWRGILVRKGTPQPIIDKLAAAFKKMTEDKTVKSMFKRYGEKTNYLGPADLTKVWLAEFAAYKELGKIYKK
jgi:tripartite-type tricarboxylate transporter receptor subunit TctC